MCPHQFSCRNVFAVQQNLTNIVGSKEQYFDRARKYYELLNLAEEVFLPQPPQACGDRC